MISDFSQKITIKRISIPEDWGFGDPTATPPEVAILSTWGAIKEMSRTQAVMQDLSVENVNYKMVIRYASGREVKKDDIIVWNGGRYKAITSSSVKEIDKKKFLETIIILQDG